MQLKPTRRRAAVAGGILLAVAALLTGIAAHASVPQASASAKPAVFCGAHPQFCTEPAEPWNYQGQYIGHDEPSLLFYSDHHGSGDSSLYQLHLPSDPPTAPAQDGSGGTWSFMLHPAFWFGMILCDDQSAPNPGAACQADTDKNIHTSLDPNSPDYFGLTPGEAFMEMQFYPPGWGGVGTGVACGPNNTQWCAALNIDSFSQSDITGDLNNSDCLNNAGEEYVNYAIITKSGHSQGPADPLDQTLATFETGPDTLEMNNGDALSVDLHDTPAGFQVVINDATTGQSGSMTASIANGFGHPLFRPNDATCTDAPYAFHPMFSSSTPSTRVLWAAHSYNVAYSDEIGHFEYCNAINHQGGHCTGYPNPTDASFDGDDRGCFTLPVEGTSVTNFTGCLATDNEFDGPEYKTGTWPGSTGADASKVTTPIEFTSPLYTASSADGNANGASQHGYTHGYEQAAFEADLPRIEDSVSPCRHTGVGCTNPPAGSTFYPIYSAVAGSGGQCIWAEGGGSIPGTINNFGGNSATEYGTTPFEIFYPAPGGFITRFNDFRNILPNNPCPVAGH